MVAKCLYGRANGEPRQEMVLRMAIDVPSIRKSVRPILIGALSDFTSYSRATDRMKWMSLIRQFSSLWNMAFSSRIHKCGTWGRPLEKMELPNSSLQPQRSPEFRDQSGSKVANHSVRKTSIGHLLDGNVPETYVAQLSGHKSSKAISHISRLTNTTRSKCLTF